MHLNEPDGANAMIESARTPLDYLLVLRRRKWLFLVPAALILILAALAAYFWPAIYRSEATILIEQAEVPEELVTTFVDDYLERRLEGITRRVLVGDNLIRIIEQYNLYSEDRKRLPVATVVDNMRANIHRELIRAEGNATQSRTTIAFTVAFDHGQPDTAQRVTNELVSLYLNANLRLRRERATETANFLRAERERAEQRIAEVGNQLAEFKRANSGSLPDQLPYNQQIIARAEQELRDLNRQMQSLKEQEIFLQAQLTLTSATWSNGQVASPAAQLDSMRTQLATMAARYGPDHPDVVKLKREVGGLERMLGVQPSPADLAAERALLQVELEALRSRYTEEHPDVRRAQRELERIEVALRSPGSEKSNSPARPDNPAYIQLQAQLNSVQSQLSALQRQRTDVDAELEAFQELVLKTPLVEREYARLERNLADANALRDELAQKEATAELGQSLETEQKAERFSLIEPPSLPATPIKPDRLAILLVGIALSMAGGLGVVALAEVLDDAIHSPREVAQIVGEGPLAVIPRIRTSVDQTRVWSLRFAGLAVLLVGAGGAAWWVHTHYVPLDIAWYDLQRRTLIKMQPYLPGPALDLLGLTASR